MRRVLFLTSVLITLFAPAQDAAKTDSLRSRAALARTDSARFDAYIELADQFLLGHPDSAYHYCQRAEAIATRTGRRKDEGTVLGWLAYLDEQRGDLGRATERYQRSLAIAERMGDASNAATILNNLAAIYKDQGRIDEAITTHQRSLTMAREQADSGSVATSLNNIGLILYDQGRIPEAMEHYTQALHLYEAVHDAEGTAATLHNIASIYRDQDDLEQALNTHRQALLILEQLNDRYSMAGVEDNIGGVLERQGRNGEALEHYRKALALHGTVDDVRGMGYSLRNIAGIELKNGIAKAALEHAQESHGRFQQAGDKRGLASAILMIGQAHDALGDRTKAMAHAQRALALARELGHPLAVRDAAALLMRLHRENGQWQQALQMQDVYFQMRDSLTSIDARRSAIRQQYRYAYEKKEAALQQEQKEKDLRAANALQAERARRNLFIIVGVGLLLFAIGLWSRLRFVRRSRSVIQRERDRSEHLLLNILPKEVADELKAHGSAEAVQIDQVTVLFTDFSGFTRMAEQLGPKELVRDIHECFSAFDRICEEHGIEKIKTIGDAYMAAGGLPTPNTTNAMDVIEAALKMRDSINQGIGHKKSTGLPYFEIRIGVHTGPVVAGIVGVKKFQYDIWGDTVNTASRMESSGEVGQVNISEATYTIVRSEPGLSFTPRGMVHAKGKGELQMFFVSRSPVAYAP